MTKDGRIREYFTMQPNEHHRNLFLALLEQGAIFRILSPEERIISCTIGNHTEIFVDEKYIFNTIAGSRLTKNKQVTRLILADAGIAVSDGIAVDLNEGIDVELIAQIENLLPVVVKPVDGHHGVGVFIGLKSIDAVREAMQYIQKEFDLVDPHAIEFQRQVVIEEQFFGSDYRILVLNGEVIACAERVPGHVIGDGIHTITDLVDIFNQTRLPGTLLLPDEEAQIVLGDAGYTWQTIPQANQRIWLRRKANLSAGGVCIDRTIDVSARFKKIAIYITEVLQLQLAGIDIMVSDISSNDPAQDYVIIEVNSRPDYYGHQEPYTLGHTDTTGILAKSIVQRFLSFSS